MLGGGEVKRPSADNSCLSCCMIIYLHENMSQFKNHHVSWQFAQMQQNPYCRECVRKNLDIIWATSNIIPGSSNSKKLNLLRGQWSDVNSDKVIQETEKHNCKSALGSKWEVFDSNVRHRIQRNHCWLLFSSKATCV